jgi:hypothetical protein
MATAWVSCMDASDLSRISTAKRRSSALTFGAHNRLDHLIVVRVKQPSKRNGARSNDISGDDHVLPAAPGLPVGFARSRARKPHGTFVE